MLDRTDSPRRWLAVLPVLVWLVACGWWATDAWEWFGLDAMRWLGPWRWAWLGVCGLVVGLPPVRRGVGGALRRAHGALGRWAAVVLVVAAGAVGLMRPGHAQGPDAGFLLERIPDGELATFSHPLSRFLLSAVDVVLAAFTGTPDIVAAFRVVGAVSLAVWVASLVHLARTLAPDDAAARRLVVLAALSSGAVLSFVGHIEVYAADAALAGWGLALATRAWATRRWRQALLSGLCLGLAAALHARELALLPVVALLVVSGRGWGRGAAPLGWALGVASVGLVWAWAGVDVATLAGRAHPGGGDGDLLLPLWTPEPPWSPTPFLSAAHARDVVQGLLFSAPAVLLWPWGAHRRDHVVLAVGTAGLLVLVSVWNPDFGARSDADLLSVVGLALAPWVGARLAAARGSADAWSAVLAALVAAHVGAHVVARALDRAVSGG